MSHDRERKVNIEQLTLEQADQLSAQLGEKVKEINDRAIAEVNKLLNIYGMEAKMAVAIGKIGEFNAKPERKKRKTRKKVQANL